MASNKVPGTLIGVRIGGVWLPCQTEAALNLIVNTSEEDPCKPDPSEVVANGGTPYISRNIDSRDWNISVSHSLLRAALAAETPDVAKLIVDDEMDVEVEFMTTPGQTKVAYDLVYSGPGILTGFTLNAPSTGSASADITIDGNGPLTYTNIPRATP